MFVPEFFLILPLPYCFVEEDGGADGDIERISGYGHWLHDAMVR